MFFSTDKLCVMWMLAGLVALAGVARAQQAVSPTPAGGGADFELPLPYGPVVNEAEEGEPGWSDLLGGLEDAEVPEGGVSDEGEEEDPEAAAQQREAEEARITERVARETAAALSSALPDVDGFMVPATGAVDFLGRQRGKNWKVGASFSAYYDSNLRNIPDGFEERLQREVDEARAAIEAAKAEFAAQVEALRLQAEELGVEMPEIIEPEWPEIDDPPEIKRDDFVFGSGLFMSYERRGPVWGLDASYTPVYMTYMENPELDGWAQNAQGALSYKAGRVDMNLAGNYALSRGTNRNAGINFVEQARYGLNWRGSYKLSGKTLLRGDFGWSATEPTGRGEGTQSDTTNYRAGLAALWRVTPLLRVGPGVKATLSESDFQGKRTGVGPSLNVEYELSRRMSVRGQVAYQFVDFNDGPQELLIPPDDTFTTADLAATWTPSAYWRMTLGVSRGAGAQGFAGQGFRETTGARAEVARRLFGRAVLSVDGQILWEDDLGGEGVIPNSETGWNTGVQLGFPIWRDNAAGSIYWRYRRNDGDREFQNYRGYQVGANISVGF